ncbi:MAG: penicillin-binding protein 2, partial [Lentisphaeria bacterium]|nr:penicillin-binding protein 2 [Lentisphaeria bacterium]
MPGKEFKTVFFRLLFFFLLIIACFIFAGKQMYHVQITRHDELLRKAQNQYRNTKTEQTTMGEIYDCDGNRLVSNHFVKTIIFDPSVVTSEKEREKTARFLSNILPNSDYNELLRKMNIDITTGKKQYYVVLARDVNFEKAIEIEKQVIGMHMRGLHFKRVNRRYYPKGRMLANILGISYIGNEETDGVSGLEGTFKKELRGEAGKITYYQAADGTMISGTLNKDISGQSGKNVYLTISEPIQAILEEEIDRLYEETGSKAVYIAMADPYTGNILAIAQRPTFDPNDRRTMKNRLASTNLISANPYEPGSVMKPFVVAMALDDGAITTDTVINTGFGEAWLYKGKYPLKDTHIVGNATPLQIIQHSSNVGTAKIAVMLGENRVHEILSSFGFGRRTGLPITPESSGRLNPVKRWDTLTITRICIGHAIMVTPLQLLRAYCMLANGGYPIELRMIDAIEDEKHGKVIQPYHISNKSIFKKPGTHREVIRMLKTVTKPGGTSSQSAVPGFEVAGKTGTANKIEN